MVGITYLWVALCLHANRRTLVHRRSGARALGSSTSVMVHIVHYDVSVHLCVSGEPLGLGIRVLGVVMDGLICVANASDVAGRAARNLEHITN